MSSNAIQLGAFELHEVVGRGGMGDVWRGKHVAQDVDVAVKVVTSSRAKLPRAIAAFRNEVHAMARLDHPGIVMVLDVGEVTTEAEESSMGMLTAGSPALAMEFASHGTLARQRDGLTWPRVRALLLSILDALAHAHARGVVHRDLKPGNVLVTGDGRNRPRLKLADFGLAQAMSDNVVPGEGRKVVGTPKYMAPEQIEGRIRDQGPWTDLYALGCLTHWLLTGRAPYEGELDDVLAGHLFDPVPAPQTDVELPSGFAHWLGVLMAKNPWERFRFAADAAYALIQLGDDPDESMEGFGDGLSELTEKDWGPPPAMDDTVIIDTSETTRPADRSSRPLDGYSATHVDLDRGEGAASQPRPGQTVRAPIPQQWRSRDNERPSLRLIGAGLGLYGLRPVPLVDREDERDTMWRALREVEETGSPRVLTLLGAAGTGKSRLAEWLAQRAVEVGAVHALRAFHGPEAGPGGGLVGMLTDHLRCGGLDRAQIHDRVRDVYFATGTVDGQDLYDCEAIAQMIAPVDEEEDAEKIQFANPTERHVVIARFLSRIADQRPLVVWIDDVQWGLDALHFVSHFLSTGKKSPIMFLLTSREEELVEESAEAETLLEITDDHRAGVLEVEALSGDDHVVLVEELLALEPQLAADVAKKTAGNPLFAVQLVGDWVQRGLLVVGDDGFALADSANYQLPDSIHDMWAERVDGFVARMQLADVGRRAMEMAATLGQEVDETEWTDACVELFGQPPEPHWLDDMVEDGLIIRRRVGFTFAHTMLQESLVRRAAEAGRTADCHRAAARMLRERASDMRPEVHERLGGHLHGAGELEASLEPLLHAAELFGERCDFERSRRILEQRGDVLDELGADPVDERRAWSEHVRVRALLRQGLVDEAGERIERWVKVARERDWPELRAEYELHLASLARKRGDSEVATEQYGAALLLFEELENPRGVAKGLYGLGEVLLYRGEVQEALDYLERAMAHMAKHELESMAGIVLIGIASALLRQDRFNQACARLDDAVASFKRVGNRGGRAAALNMLGELERARGDLAAAQEAYETSIEMLRSIGSRGTTIPRLNLGLVYLARSRWEKARATLQVGMDELHAIGEVSHVGFVHLGLVCAAAGLEDWDAFDHHLAEASRTLDEADWVDRDLAEHAGLAASLAETAGEEERAQAAAALSQAQWDALGEKRTVLTRYTYGE